MPMTDKNSWASRAEMLCNGNIYLFPQNCDVRFGELSVCIKYESKAVVIRNK